MTPILELKNVSAGYDHEVILHQVNLKIYEHDFLGIIGPNGGGKTTLLKVILGLLKPYSGEVIYPVSRQNLFGYLPQNSRFDQRFPIDVTEVVLSGLMSEKGLYKSYTRAEKQKAWDYSINTVWEHIRKHRSAIYRADRCNGYSFAGRSLRLPAS